MVLPFPVRQCTISQYPRKERHQQGCIDKSPKNINATNKYHLSWGEIKSCRPGVPDFFAHWPNPKDKKSHGPQIIF
jgi:hypothetical protein